MARALTVKTNNQPSSRITRHLPQPNMNRRAPDAADSWFRTSAWMYSETSGSLRLRRNAVCSVVRLSIPSFCTIGSSGKIRPQFSLQGEYIKTIA